MQKFIEFQNEIEAIKTRCAKGEITESYAGVKP